MAIYVRDLTDSEEETLRKWLEHEDPEMRHRARVILLSHAGYRVPEISTIVDAHPTNLRKWIHRFNDDGPDGLISPRSGGAPPRFSEEQKQEIVELAQIPPKELNLPFRRWTLHKLAEQAAERDIVDSISHEYVRQLLMDADVDHREAHQTNNHHQPA